MAGEPVELTNREFELLHTLMENKNIVMDREKLLNIVCGYEYVGEELPEDFVCPLCKHPASDFEKIVKKVE